MNIQRSILFTLMLFSQFSFSQTPTVSLSQITTGYSRVTVITHCGDERLFIVEQAGRIKWIKPFSGSLTPTLFMNIDPRVGSSGNEQGLLGLAFPADFTQTGKFYVNYTNNTGSTVISRFYVSAANPDTANPASEEILLTIAQPYSNHNGGCIQFGPDGYLYIGMGDGGSAGDPQGNAQNDQSLLGKMLRIDVSGTGAYTIPADNPFASAGDNIRDEIWAKGLRNPWKFSFDRVTGDMWIADVGQNAAEEVNYQAANSTGGENYGWKCYEGNASYSGCAISQNLVYPIYTYPHSGAISGCSITGGYVFRSNVYRDLVGRYFFADYCSARIWSSIPDGNGAFTTSTHGVFGSSYTTFGEDRYGNVYIGEATGKISRITSTAFPAASIDSTGNLSFCQGDSIILSTPENPLLSYAWYKNNELIAEATSNMLVVRDSGSYKVIVANTNGTTVSDSVTVTNYSIPQVSLNSDFTKLCEDAAFPIALNGSPDGGVFSGTGVNESSFNPFQLGAGTYIISYVFTTDEGCIADTAFLTITLDTLPAVSIAELPTDFCLNAPVITLSGNPVGGTFSGPGISGATFNPFTAGVGVHSISYTVADGNGCANFDSVSFQVNECLGLNESKNNRFTVQPNPTSGNTRITIPKELNACSVLIINTFGQVCFVKNINPQTELFSEQISFDQFSTGLYYVLVEMLDGERIAECLILQD
jgi:glucose/arabinose dehydrogenase